MQKQLTALCVLGAIAMSCSNDGSKQPAAFAPTIDAKLAPTASTVPDAKGKPQAVAASRDAAGVITDFVEGVVRVSPVSEAQLADFLERYDGKVVADNALPPAPEGFVFESDVDRKATEFLVRVALSRADTDGFAERASDAGLEGAMSFSTTAGLQTMAVVAEARANGFAVAPDIMSYKTQTFPTPLFQSMEGVDGAGKSIDAFTVSRFGTGGSQSNVTLAWQFVAAHGIARRVTVAVLDDGFWLTGAGLQRTADSDFPAQRPAQRDFVQNDATADGPGVTGCGSGNPCFWHGTGSAGVAVGLLNNMGGAAGTGGLVASPILLRISGQRSQINSAVRYAVALGADVVTMSFGTNCNQACRIYDRDNTPFDDAVNSGKKTVFVAAAGNGDSAGNGYDTGAPNFVHPCIEDHVMCVGALNDNATNKIGYSNFGGAVALFAPTNIPAMTRPAGNDSNPNGPTSPQSFGGTSAATPFVAGVAALVKAINPDLNSDAVSKILRDTAHRGPAPVDRYIDAYAAVRKAAEGIPGVQDRFEVGVGGNATTPTELGARESYSEPNLSISARNDRDTFQFESPGATTATIDIMYPPGLGALSLSNVESLSRCGMSVPLSEADLAGRGRRYTFAMAGGPHKLSITGGDINAYNLGVSFSYRLVPDDDYEDNDTVVMARFQYTQVASSPTMAVASRFDPQFTLQATIGGPLDVDYYIVRGTRTTLADKVLLNAYSAVQVYGNDAPLTLDVYELAAGSTQGALVQTVTSGSCSKNPLTVALESDAYYLVRVAGSSGAYTLRNGLEGERKYTPDIVRDQVYVVLHPGDPIEHVIRNPEIYVFTGDQSYSQIRASIPEVHVQLFDSASQLIAEGVAPGVGAGESLSLAKVQTGQVYAMTVTPQVPDKQLTLRLEWDPVAAASVSTNLIANPGAETVTGSDPSQDVPEWTVRDGLASPRIYFYDAQATNPSPTGPGPAERGDHLFSGGPNNVLSGVRQTIAVPEALRQSVDVGKVKYTFSAYLGGLAAETDTAEATLTFVGAASSVLGSHGLSPVTAFARENMSGLFPEQVSDYLPVGTTSVYVDLTFHGGTGDFNDGYIDNLALTLSQFP